MFAINGAIVGLELFDNAATWRKSMRKIVESYGLDALDRREDEEGQTTPDPAGFLASVSATAVESFKAVGLGEDLRLRSPQVAGAALAVDQKVVHLLAYAC